MALNSIDGIFEAITKLKVLIIGDVMVDEYSYGTVSRTSPEAPVPVVNVNSTEKRLGGAANVALNIKAMGAEAILCSVIGDDQSGEDFISLLKDQKLPSAGVIKSSDRQTTVKHRILSGSQHLLRIDTEEDKPLNPLDHKAMINHIEKLMANVDLVIFEDYDKGLLDPEMIKFTVGKATALDIPTAVDPKYRNFFAYEGVTLFKPNLREMSAGLGFPVEPEKADLQKAVGQLLDKMAVDNVLITLSRKGVYYHSGRQSALLPAYDRSVADISGAGDTVISIAALALSLHLPSGFIAEFANLGGGIVCEYQGVVAIDAQRLLEEARNSRILQEYLTV